jgi:hypothetical protein
VKHVKKASTNFSKILKKSFEKSKCKNKVQAIAAFISILSEHILKPYEKENKELRCYED